MTIHHVDVQHGGAATLDCPDLFAKTREVCGKNRRSDFDVTRRAVHFNYAVWAAEPAVECFG